MKLQPERFKDLDSGGLYFVQPDPERTGEQPDDQSGSALVGLVVRGPASADRPGVGDRDASLRRIQADVKHLIGEGPVVTTELSAILEPGQAAQLKTAHLANVDELLTKVRNLLAHDNSPFSRAMVLHGPRGDIAHHAVAAEEGRSSSVALLDSMIETARAQLRLLIEFRDTQAAPAHEDVAVQTATGPFRYRLPLSLDDTFSSTEASTILSPTGKPHRTIAQNRRRANELLGVKIGNRYRYPKFQVDPAKHEIRPVVAHANRRLESDADPWGALDWWFSEDEGLGGRRPVDLLQQHELGEDVVDFAIDRSQQGMD
ncbi:hypothetical protein [Mycobacterium sp.]|uniref:hypothetical protein n=1 Tax=Mycobacterium sp. TaxID=1785 RepID=UPI003D10D344